MSAGTSRRYPRELKERAVRMVTEVREHGLPIAPWTYYDRLHAVASARQVPDEQLRIEIEREHAVNFGVCVAPAQPQGRGGGSLDTLRTPTTLIYRNGRTRSSNRTRLVCSWG